MRGPTVPERMLSKLPRPVVCWVYRRHPDSRLWRDAAWLNFYGKEYRMGLKQNRGKNA